MNFSATGGMKGAPHVHERFPELRESLPYLRLGTAPSPVSKLPSEMRSSGELWLKDEAPYGDGGL